MGWNLSELIDRHGVPGTQVAVLVNGEIQDEAAGVLSLRTRVEATTDSVFQIGSITKIWTATLVQQLVNEGVLDLDCPVRGYLPDFKLSDPLATESLTTRHLLTHTGGFEGDLFTDTGLNEDAIEKFVGTLTDAEQISLPGTAFSYSNSGFVVLGRLLEVLRGKPYHEVLREHLVDPLGLETVCTNAYEAILHRAAVGHQVIDDELVPVRKWGLAYSNAPVGAMLAMSARDLLSFVRLHLNDASLVALREPQVTSVPSLGGDLEAWGLGWMLHRNGVIGHTGSVMGQNAFLRVVPSAGVAVAVLTNGGSTAPLAREIITEALREHAGIETPPLPVPPANPAPIDAARMCGTYRTTLIDQTLSVEDGRAYLTTTARNELGEWLLGNKPEHRAEVVRFADDTIISLEPERGGHYVYDLTGSDAQGRAQYLHNMRASYRIT